MLRFLADWPLLPYNLVLLITSPVILLLKALRYFRKGWKREYDMARWFIPDRQNPITMTGSLKGKFDMKRN